MALFNFMIENEFRDRIRKAAEEAGISMSKLVRSAVEEYLEKEKEKENT
jgi:predicted HicB family RNase H-like nuclease